MPISAISNSLRVQPGTRSDPKLPVLLRQREGAIVGTSRRVHDCGARAMDSCVYSYSWLDQPHDVKRAAARFAVDQKFLGPYVIGLSWNIEGVKDRRRRRRCSLSYRHGNQAIATIAGLLSPSSMEGRRCFSRRGDRQRRTRRLVRRRCRSSRRWLRRDGCCSWLPWCFRVDKPWDAFSRRDVTRRGLSERRYFFANILFGRLHRQNVSGHLLLSVR